MSKLNFSVIFVLLLIWGTVVEVDNAYKHSMGISNIVMPAVKVIKIPMAFKDTVTEVPIVRHWDASVCLTSTLNVVYDARWGESDREKWETMGEGEVGRGN